LDNTPVRGRSCAGAPRLDAVRAWGEMELSVGAPRLGAVRAWGEMGLSVGAPLLDAVRAWGLHSHIIALEWDNVTQVIVG